MPFIIHLLCGHRSFSTLKWHFPKNHYFQNGKFTEILATSFFKDEMILSRNGSISTHSRTLILGTIKVLWLKSTITAYFYDAKFDESKSMIMPKYPITSTTQGIQKKISKFFQKNLLICSKLFSRVKPNYSWNFSEFSQKRFLSPKNSGESTESR